MNINRTLNIVASLVTLLSFLLTGSTAMLLATLAVQSFLLLGGPVVRAVEARTDISFDLKPSCTVGQELTLGISVTRPPVFRGSTELVFSCRNAFLGTEVHVPVTLSPASGTVERFELPLDTTRVGRISVELISARAIDVFGFSSAPLHGASFLASYTVYPDVSDIEAIARRAYRAAESGLVFDRHRSGQDLSEVFELRDYRDGDSMRRVHWKLSARFDEPMVRVPSHPADFDLALGFAPHGRDAELAGRTAVINAAASTLGAVSRALLKRSIGHCVVYRDGSVLQVDAVESELGFDRMLDGVLGTTIPVDVEHEARTFASLQRLHGITKLVLVTDAIQESLFGELAALCELTVIYLGGEDGLSLDDSDGYVLVRLSAEAAASRVKSLEL